MQASPLLPLGQAVGLCEGAPCPQSPFRERKELVIGGGLWLVSAKTSLPEIVFTSIYLPTIHCPEELQAIFLYLVFSLQIYTFCHKGSLV